MSKTKGMPKTGGRTKGTPNKVTSDLRAWITELLDSNRKQITNDIESLEPHQRVIIFEKLMSYVLPKLQSVEMETKQESKSDFDMSILTDEEHALFATLADKVLVFNKVYSN
jgi:hypothetical protein